MSKFARPPAHGVLDLTGCFSFLLNIMNSLNLINLLINRARTRAALGTPFSKRTPPPSRRRAGAEPLTNRRGKF